MRGLRTWKRCGFGICKSEQAVFQRPARGAAVPAAVNIDPEGRG